MNRPTVAPMLLARLLDLLPVRLRRRFDAEPGLASSWTWTSSANGWCVQIDDDTAVTLTAEVLDDLAQLRCTCLLSPRCLHVAACLATLDASAASASALPVTAAASSVVEQVVTNAHHAAANAALAAAGAVLAAGVRSAGAGAQALLLRALHDARGAGWHRLAGGLARLVSGVKGARIAALAAADVVADLREVLAVACGLLALPLAAALPSTLLGTARRAYGLIGGLRLVGWLAEPVLTRGGYAGVVTHLVDAQGRRWTLSAVRPGALEQVHQAWEGGAGLGDLSLSQRELARGGCVVQDATASADGRLGAGAAVKAVSAPGVAWDQSPLAEQFAKPLAEQVTTAFAVLDEPGVRPAGDVLLACTGRLSGSDAQALHLLTDDGVRLRLEPASWDPRLAFVANLERLSAALGARVRVVGRLVVDRPGTLEALAIGPAIGPADDATATMAVRLPAASVGRLLLGLEHVAGGGLPAGAPPPPSTVERHDPWSAPARRLESVLAGGRATIASSAVAGALEREADALVRGLSPQGAVLLRGLYQACGSVTDRWGRLVAPPAEQLARSWAALALYLDAAKRHHARACWLALLAQRDG